jgi:lipoyl(octanoyl) transferase
MQDFTDTRQSDTEDELWFLQHPPVYTLGKNGKAEHVLNSADIPVVNSDRGGQVTYHGPGQVVVYTLLDLKRLKMGVRELVTLIEQTIVNVLASYGIDAATRRDAPGVYVKDAKIAALGLRVRKGCSFHGLALNVDMDMEPFSRINPCGYEGLEVTQLSHFVKDIRVANVVDNLQQQFLKNICVK